VIRLKFQARELVGIERRLQGMVIDVVVLLQFRFVVDGGRNIADDLSFVGLARNQTATLKLVEAATGRLGLLDAQSFRCGLHLGCHFGRALRS
jgi:hypothetical protein